MEKPLKNPLVPMVGQTKTIEKPSSLMEKPLKTIATNGLPDQKPLIPMVAFQPFIGTSEFENLEKFQLQSQ